MIPHVQPETGPWRRWVAAAILLAVGVLAALFWLHYAQRQDLRQATGYLDELRQAQIELSKGFLQMSLADNSESPFNRYDGLALLQQSVLSIQRAMVMLGVKDSKEAEMFKQDAVRFAEQLEAWRRAEAVDPKSMVSLRIAFAALERQAGQVDAVSQRRIATLIIDNEHVFAMSLLACLLALGSIIGIMARFALKERQAVAELVPVYQAKLRSEARFRRLFLQAPVAMILVDGSEVVLAQNARFTQLFGYTPEDMPTLADWWPLAYPEPRYRAQVQASWRALVARASAHQDEIKSEEYRVNCKDGCERIVQIHGILMAEGLLATFLDVTERRHTENRLRLWTESFEQAQVGLVIVDARTNRLVAVNPAFARERGYTRDEMRDMPLQRLYPDDRMMDVQRIIQELDAVSHGVFETEHLCKDGRRFPVLVDVTVLRDAHGRPLTRVKIVVDITQRKRAERELIQAQAEAQQRQARARLAILNQMQDTASARLSAEAALAALSESESRLKLFINYAPASLAMFDRDMRYIAFSRRWLDDYGFGERDLFGLSHYQVFPEIGAGWKDVHQRAMAGEVVRCEEDRFERADGRVQWLRWEVRPWYKALQQVGGIVVFSEDITARVLARQALRKSEAHLHALISTIPDLIWLKDTRGVFLLCNQAVERLYGAPEADILGKTDYDFVEPELADVFHANDCRALETKGVVSNEEWLTFAENGRRGLFQTLKAPVADADGQLIGVLGIARDITVLRQVEEELRVSNAGLEARVAERTAELETLNQSLESFVYSVSHDLKAPLRGIEGYSQLLLEDYGDAFDADGQLFIANIRNGVARMGQLIDDLLAYSRMERCKLAIDPLNLADLIKQLLAERGDELAARGVDIRADLPAVWVRGDANGLGIVLRNLLENALKFSAQAEKPRIEISAREQDDHVIVRVADNGMGFDMMYHDRIFEIFQRLHRLEDYPGTGVGLALVKKAMQRMGGQVWAESEPGQGASFYLQLPLAQPEALSGSDA